LITHDSEYFCIHSKSLNPALEQNTPRTSHTLKSGTPTRRAEMQSTAQYSPDSTLTPTQHHVLSLLAQGASINAAANAAGIHRNTVANWRRVVPAFAREFEFAARERALFWHDHASGLAEKAVEVLSTILNDESAAPSLRLRAALKVISMATEITPNPGPAKPYPAFTAEVEAVHGQLLMQQVPDEEPQEAQREAAQEAASENPEPAQPAKNVHNSAQPCTNQPIRRPAEPGRNTPCPCGSGVKYKRCCATRPAGGLAMAS
jgi:hypothetical protein